jgi:hypothetical protein
VADLEGGPTLFCPKLNVSKTQDFRPKIREFFAIFGGAPPLSGVRNFWIRHCYIFTFWGIILLKIGETKTLLY